MERLQKKDVVFAFLLSKTSTVLHISPKPRHSKLSNVDTTSTLPPHPPHLTVKISKFQSLMWTTWRWCGGILHVFKSPARFKGFNPNVEDVEVFASSAETSQPSMLSCTTEPAFDLGNMKLRIIISAVIQPLPTLSKAF
jgi:hypothetical protein